MDYKNLEEVLKTIELNQLVMLVGSTKNCGVCTTIKPRLRQLAEKYTQLEEIYIWVDSLIEASGEFMIFTVPTIIVFAEGKEVHRESRIIDFKRLEFEISRWDDFLSEHQ